MMEADLKMKAPQDCARAQLGIEEPLIFSRRSKPFVTMGRLNPPSVQSVNGRNPYGRNGA
jgi:hypothetical protein